MSVPHALAGRPLYIKDSVGSANTVISIRGSEGLLRPPPFCVLASCELAQQCGRQWASTWYFQASWVEYGWDMSSALGYIEFMGARAVGMCAHINIHPGRDESRNGPEMGQQNPEQITSITEASFPLISANTYRQLRAFAWIRFYRGFGTCLDTLANVFG